MSRHPDNLSAWLSWAAYQDGLKNIEIEKQGGYSHPISRLLGRAFRRGEIFPVYQAVIESFCQDGVFNGNIEIKDGVLSMDGFNVCTFVASVENGRERLNIAIRGTETGIGTMRSVHRYFAGDYMRISRHFDKLQPMLRRAIEHAIKWDMDVHFTGHSLGGSVAQTAAATFKKEFGDRVTITSTVFGSPGGEHFADAGMRRFESAISQVGRYIPFEPVRSTLFNVVSLGFNIAALAIKPFIRKDPSKDGSMAYKHKNDPIPKVGSVLYGRASKVVEIEQTRSLNDGLMDAHSMSNYAHSLLSMQSTSRARRKPVCIDVHQLTSDFMPSQLVVEKPIQEQSLCLDETSGMQPTP